MKVKNLELQVLSIRLSLVCCATFLLVACVDSKKNKLPGQRYSVFDSNQAVSSDFTVKKCLHDERDKIHFIRSRQIATPQSVGITNKPVVLSDKVVILNTNGILMAYDLDLKKLIWKFNVDLDHFRVTAVGKITHFDNVLYVTYGTNRIVAINSKNGAMLWSNVLDDVVKGRVTVSADKVFLQSAHNHIYALNKNTGAYIWRHKEIYDEQTTFADFTPVIYDQKLFFQVYNGEVKFLELNSGSEIGSISTSAQYNLNSVELQRYIPNHFFINNGLIYSHAKDGKIAAIDYQTQKEKWKSSIKSSTKFLLHNGKIYFVTDKNELAALNALDGKILYLLELRGCVKHKEKYGKWTRPVLYNQDSILLASYDGELLRIDLKDGVLKAISDKKMAFITSSPAVYKERVYVLSNNGTIYHYQ